MCQAIRDGGLRCPSYARRVLDVADETLDAARDSATRAWQRWDSLPPGEKQSTALDDYRLASETCDAAQRAWIGAASEYAATPTGRQHLIVRAAELDGTVDLALQQGEISAAETLLEEQARISDALRRGDLLRSLATTLAERNREDLAPTVEAQPINCEDRPAYLQHVPPHPGPLGIAAMLTLAEMEREAARHHG